MKKRTNQQPRNPLTDIQRRIKANQEAQQAAAEQLTFIDFPADRRAAPNQVIRSALFGVIMKGRRTKVEDEIIPAQGDFTIRYSGYRLDQSDLDIWVQVLFYCRNSKPGTRVQFKMHDLLRQTGRSTGKRDYQWLKQRLEQMVGSSTVITDGRGRSVATGGLIREYGQDPETGSAYVELNPRFRAAFEDYTLFDPQERLALRGDLEKWLHLFLSSHAAPYPMKTETYRKLCGSTIKELFQFRDKLRRALRTLKEKGLIEDWRIDEEDKVHVQRKPTPSQQRHLALAAAASA